MTPFLLDLTFYRSVSFENKLLLQKLLLCILIRYTNLALNIQFPSMTRCMEYLCIAFQEMCLVLMSKFNFHKLCTVLSQDVLHEKGKDLYKLFIKTCEMIAQLQFTMFF